MSMSGGASSTSTSGVAGVAFSMAELMAFEWPYLYVPTGFLFLFDSMSCDFRVDENYGFLAAAGELSQSILIRMIYIQ